MLVVDEEDVEGQDLVANVNVESQRGIYPWNYVLRCVHYYWDEVPVASFHLLEKLLESASGNCSCLTCPTCGSQDWLEESEESDG